MVFSSNFRNGNRRITSETRSQNEQWYSNPTVLFVGAAVLGGGGIYYYFKEGKHQNPLKSTQDLQSATEEKMRKATETIKEKAGMDHPKS